MMDNLPLTDTLHLGYKGSWTRSRIRSIAVGLSVAAWRHAVALVGLG
jgi:hypothetical protein